MKQKHELVATHCKHEDCVYRRIFYADETPCCMYAAIEHQVRGCKISECTRYVKGERTKPRIGIATDIWWEYELYDEEREL